MDTINPYYKVNEEDNIFLLRQKEYAGLERTIREVLKPAEELGFVIKEFGTKESRFSSGEINKTLKKNLVIRLQKGTSEVDLSMYIPKLVDRNYIVINGRKKIPQFQLFDVPIVTRGKHIKLRTNVATLMVSEEREPPFISLSLLGKKVPFVTVLFAYHGAEEVAKKFDLPTKHKAYPDNLWGRFLVDLNFYYENFKDRTKEEFIKDLGMMYSKFNAASKGEDVVYALDLILKTDVVSARFFRTNSVLDELIEVIKGKEYSDTDFINKRIRCFEYMVVSKVSKVVFDLCMANRTSKQPKFNVNSTQILSECNVSDIVQFDFAINPIDELTRLSRTSLLGPGGFNRENVPEHLRDIYPSMFGRICPVDTPDRDNCGVLQSLIPNTKLDKDLKFTEEVLEKQPISIPVSLVPFLEHDDQTRLQMASSQMRQAIMLASFDRPLVQSGCESLYTKYTQFVKVAKRSGEVIYVDNKFIIVRYDNKETDIFDISCRRIYVENLDIMKVYVEAGTKVKAGDILAESYFCNDGKINFGKNLLTAVMVYYGHNYEDGIVISDRLVKDEVFTSVHYKDLSFILPPNKVLLTLDEKVYKPLPNVSERVPAGDPYAIVKEIPSGASDYYSIFEESNPLVVRKNTVISEVNVYPNKWNSDVPEFKSWVENRIEKQRKEENELQKVLFENLPKEYAAQFIRDKGLDKFSQIGKYKMKRERINGIFVELFGIYVRRIELGDKIGNRHGNKGVISKIVPHEKMPQLDDGRHVDVCINPLGIISRMNIGQLFELHLSMSLVDLRENMLQMFLSNKSQEELKKYLLDYLKIIDGTEDKWLTKQFESQLGIIDEKFIENLILIQPPFESITMDVAMKALEYTNTPFEQELYDPVSKTKLLNKVAVGYLYFLKMIHIAEERLAARGIGSYAKKTLQPLGGRKHRGGQRCGEMETACLIAHDGPINLFEFLTTKSDCIDLKNRYIREMVDTDLVKETQEECYVAESVKLLDAYLTVIGVSKN